MGRGKGRCMEGTGDHVVPNGLGMVRKLALYPDNDQS